MKWSPTCDYKPTLNDPRPPTADFFRVGQSLADAGNRGPKTGDRSSSLLRFHRGSNDSKTRVSFYFLRPDQTLGNVIEKTPGSILTVLDLRAIIDRVLGALELTVFRTSRRRRR